jgi:hypothetical protein
MGYALPDPLREIRELASQNAALIALSRVYEQSPLIDCVQQIERMQHSASEMMTLLDNSRLAQQLNSIASAKSAALKELADGFSCRGLLDQLDPIRETLANQATRLRSDIVTSLIDSATQALRPNLSLQHAPWHEAALEVSQPFAFNAPVRHCGDAHEETPAWDAIQSSPGEWELPASDDDATERDVTALQSDAVASRCSNPAAVMVSVAEPVAEYLGFAVAPLPPRVACPGSTVDGAIVSEVRPINGRVHLKIVVAGGMPQDLIWPSQRCDADLSLTFRLRNYMTANNDELY